MASHYNDGNNSMELEHKLKNFQIELDKIDLVKCILGKDSIIHIGSVHEQK